MQDDKYLIFHKFLKMLDILYEDNHFIIVNKPSGILVQQDKQKHEENIESAVKAYIKEKFNKPGEVFVGIPHRIDRPTSGVVITCRTSKALERVNEMFQRKEIKKTYWAIVKNVPPKEADTLIHYLRKDEKQNRTFAYEKEVPGSQRAEMHYEIIARSDRYCLLQIQIITGRHHQIRAQLSQLKCPIRGDLKYGYDRSNPGGGIDLHARSVAFIHPVTKLPLFIEAPIRKDVLWEAITKDL